MSGPQDRTVEHIHHPWSNAIRRVTQQLVTRDRYRNFLGNPCTYHIPQRDNHSSPRSWMYERYTPVAMIATAVDQIMILCCGVLMERSCG